jgi:transcriptional regulator with XRE-family HTH domain
MSKDRELETLAGFGRRLRSLRNFFGFGRIKFAHILGLEVSQLTAFEGGERQPSFRILRRISDLTTCDLDLLITGKSYGDGDGLKGVSVGWKALYGGLIAGEQGETSPWYWESDEHHRLTLSCRPIEARARPEGPIGSTRWDYLGADPATHEHWGRHFKALESRRPIQSFVFRGHSSFIKVAGKPAFGPNGRFLGYRGYAAPASVEEAMSEWRASQDG